MNDLRVFNSIGGPRLVSDGSGFELALPRHVMLDLAKACMVELLHNGTVDQATDVVQLAREVVNNY